MGNGEEYITRSFMFSPNTIWAIKSRRIIWAGHVVRKGETRDVYRFFYKET